MTREEDFDTTERVANLSYLLTIGRMYTATQVSMKYGIDLSTATRMLDKMSLGMPVYRDDEGIWRLAESLDN